MRDNWQTVRLGDLCTIKGRIGFRGYTRQDLVEKGEGAITLRPSNIVDDKLNLDKCQYISWFKYDESPEIMIFEGDIIYAKTASIGKVALVKDLPEKATINPQFVVFKNIKCNRSFLYYAVRSHGFKEQVSLITNGVAIPTVSQSNLEKLHIKLPSVSEQQRIVDELDLLTGIIDKKNAQLRDLDALAQSIFYEMFGDPITNDKGWECCALKDVATIVGGSTPKTNIEEYWGGSNYWVTPAELHGERYYGATERTISDLAVKSTNLTLLPIGTVLLSSRAPIGKVAITTVPMYCNQGFKNVICSDRINNEYICQALRGKTEYLQALGTGATFKEISKKTTENIKIAIPPLALQKKFAAKVQMIEQQKKVVAQSLVDAQALFDSKMSHYFV